MFAQLIDIWSEYFAWVWISSVPRQAFLVFGVAILVRCCPRMAAAWRHWMWLVAALAVGLIPLAATLLPQWPVIPAEWIYGPAVSEATKIEAASLLGVGIGGTPGQGGQAFGWVEGCFVIWLVGVSLLMARLVAGMMGLRSFQRGRMPVYKGRLCARLEYCRRLAGVTTLVDLYLSKRSPLPMTWGVLRPAVNLPREAENWSNERLDAVFLHELGHIQRADCWTNMVLKVVCALNWFNPFVWMAARRTYLAQEVACDDFACAKLRPSDYARHLVELTAVVRDFHRREIEPAVGLSSCDHLRIRVAAALDPKRSRRALPSRMASLMSGVVFLLMGGVAMISLRFVDESRAALALQAPDPPPVTPAPPAKEGEREGDEETVPEAVHGQGVVLRIGREEEEGPGEELNLTGAGFPFDWMGPAREEEAMLGPPVPQAEKRNPLAPPLVMREIEAGHLSGGMIGGGKPTALSNQAVASRETPPVVPARIVVKKTVVVVPPRVELMSNQWSEAEVDWKDFQRRPGKRRGRSVVLNYAESVCNRYSRLSPMDRAREGGIRRYLERHGIHWSDARIGALIARMRNRL